MPGRSSFYLDRYGRTNYPTVIQSAPPRGVIFAARPLCGFVSWFRLAPCGDQWGRTEVARITQTLSGFFETFCLVNAFTS
jgi:hypothetical protein